MPLLITRAEKPLPEQARPLADFLFSEKLPEFPPVELRPDNDAYIMYTSGSTGTPKGVVATHRAIINAVMSWQMPIIGMLMACPHKIQEIRPRHRPSVLLSVPLFHVSGCVGGFLSSFFIRQKVVMTRKWNPEEALRLVENERITRLGEKVAAVVVLNPGQQVNEEQLRAFLKGKLATFKIPEYIWLQSESLPKLGSGKVFKRKVRQDMLALFSNQQ